MAERRAANDPWDLLRDAGIGRPVEISTPDGSVWRGALLPSSGFSGERIAILKLESGYNVGVRVAPTSSVRILGDAPPKERTVDGPARSLAPKAGEWIAVLTTGGTIASRVDYRTGGVRPVTGEGEILSFYPDLQRDGPVRVLSVFDRLSEEIVPADWQTLADRIVSVFADGAIGVVVAHGTDTMAFTAAALSFVLEDLPGPVVLVGAQRSPDRPSSDGFSNLAEAARLARHPQLAEVVVLMHEGLSDSAFSIHRGTRVRKMHSTRRDAFRSRNGPPLGRVEGGTVTLRDGFRARAAGPAKVGSRLDTSGGLLWFYPGLSPARAEAFAKGLRGVVLAGTGLGHASVEHLSWIRPAVANGQVVVMTTQCLEGRADPYVYSTGRELLGAGVVFLDDLLPETAYAKLLWALGRSSDPREVERLMLADRAGEFELRHPPAGSG